MSSAASSDQRSASSSLVSGAYATVITSVFRSISYVRPRRTVTPVLLRVIQILQVAIAAAAFEVTASSAPLRELAILPRLLPVSVATVSYQDQRGIFYAVFAAVVVVLCGFAHIVQRTMHSDTVGAVWLHATRFFFAALPLLAMPLLLLAVRFLRCDYDTLYLAAFAQQEISCWADGNIITAVFGFFMVCMLAPVHLVAALTVFEHKPAESATSAPHGRFQFLEAAAQILVALAFVVVDDHPAAPQATGLVLFAGLVIACVLGAPFYRQSTTTTVAGFYGASAGLCLAALLDPVVPGDASLIVHVVLVAVGGLASAVAAQWRASLLRSRVAALMSHHDIVTALSTPDAPPMVLFKQAYEADVLARFHEADGRPKEALATLMAAQQQFPASGYLMVAFMMLLSRLGHKQLLKITSTDIQRKSSHVRLDLKYIFIRLDDERMAADQSSGSLAIAFRLRQISRMIAAHQSNQHRFWQVILRHNSDLALSLPPIVSRMEALEQKIDNVYRGLFNKYPNSPVILRHYALYQLNVHRDQDEYQKFFAMSEDAEANDGTAKQSIFVRALLTDPGEIVPTTKIASRRGSKVKPSQSVGFLIPKSGNNSVKEFHSDEPVAATADDAGYDSVEPASEDENSTHDSAAGETRGIRFGDAPAGVAGGTTVIQVAPSAALAKSASKYRVDSSAPSTSRQSHNSSTWKGYVRRRAGESSVFSRIRFASNISFVLLFLGAAITFALTAELLSEYRHTALIVHEAGSTRELLHSTAFHTRTLERALRLNDTATIHTEEALMSEFAGVLDHVATDLHGDSSAGAVVRAWNDPNLVVHEAFGDVIVERHVSLFEGLQEAIFNVVQLSLLRPSDMADGEPSSVIFVIENAPNSLAHGLEVLVDAYADVAERHGHELHDQAAIILGTLSGTILVCVGLIFYPALRRVQRERATIYELFRAVPKSSVANAMEQSSSMSQRRTEVDEEDGAAAMATGHTGNSQSSGGRRVSAMTDMLRTFAVYLGFLLAFSFAMGIVTIHFSGTSTYVGHEVDLADRRVYLGRRAVFLAQEIAIGANSTYSHELDTLLDEDLHDMEEVNNALLQGSDEYGVPGSLYRFPALTNLYLRAPCDDLFPGCHGLTEAQVFFMDMARAFRYLPAEEQHIDSPVLADLGQAYEEVVGPMLVQAVDLYVRDGENLVGYYRVLLTILFVLCFPALILALVMMRWAVNRAQEDQQRILTMLLHLPTQVLENVKIIGAFLADEDATDDVSQLLRESEEKTKSIFQASADAVIILTEKGKIETVNRAAVEMFGYSDDKEMIGLVDKDVVPNSIVRFAKRGGGSDDEDPDEIDNRNRSIDIDIANKIKRLDSSADFDSTLRVTDAKRKDGSTFPVQLSVARGGMGGGTFFAAFVRDMTKAVERERMLIEVKEKAEALTLSLFPRSIALRLMNDETSIAEAHPSVSILFVDIVNFTGLSAAVSPPEILFMLNAIFGIWDDLVYESGLEKVKTIGDALMVGAGFPEADPHHAARICKFALDLLASMELYNQKTQRNVQCRVGISSGPIVAGLVGKTRTQYDIWGDTVNLASRMESKGSPGRIQVCPTTKAMVEGMFDFEDRGEIDVKGKGHVNTFFLLGVKAGTTLDIPARTENSYSIYEAPAPVPSLKMERRDSTMPSSNNMQSLFALSQEHNSQGSRTPRLPTTPRNPKLPLVEEAAEDAEHDDGSGVGTASRTESKADPLEIEGEGK